MSLVAKALWYIENNYARPGLALDDVAAACDASRFHLTCAFGLATGHSLMRYLRARRLSEAARALAAGAPDILALALDAGYGSHEAFTRAFREQWGVTPEALRARGHCGDLALVDAIRLDAPLASGTPFAAPRLIGHPAFPVAGLCAHYTFDSAAGIPALWQRYALHAAGVVRATPYDYGVCLPAAGDGYDYVCGAQPAGRVPDGLALFDIPAQRYAVFFHAGHISTIRMTFRAIYDIWLPASGLCATNGPEFERYDERFDGATGSGGVEIWIPVTLP